MRAKYGNLHIIEPTASIPTKVCTTLKTVKCSSLMFQNAANKSKMADGRHFRKSEIAILRNRLTAFDEIWRGDACCPLQRIDC